MDKVNLPSNEYVAYQKMYLDLVDDQPIVEVLQKSLHEFENFISELTDEQMNYAYQKGKWTIKEVVLHMIDTERIFQYRALRFSRKDQTHLPGFSENDFVPHSNANLRTKASLVQEYKGVRMSTIVLYETFNSSVEELIGNSSGGTMSVRALGYLIVGHQAHHLSVIKERYMV
ncbi:MAG: DinB family protein [Flavobacteriaceae bacterium]